MEAKIVQDALGAISLARCLQVGGTQQLTLYDYNDPFCCQRFPDDKRYILDHYFQKLRHLPVMPFTLSERH